MYYYYFFIQNESISASDSTENQREILKKLLKEMKQPVTVLLSTKQKENQSHLMSGSSIKSTMEPSETVTSTLKSQASHSSNFTSPFSNDKLDESECKIYNFEFCEKLDNFEFCEEHDPGSIIKTYRIKHIKIGKYYIAKRISKKNSSVIHKEIEIIENLNNPFIIKFHCLIKSDTGIFQIFDYVKGSKSSNFINFINMISEDNFRILASELILAFKYFQEQKVSIIDVKSNNILIDENGHLKIIDFEGVKSFESKETDSCSNVGAVTSRPPEVIRVAAGLSNNFLVEPLDWYFLGLILYHLFHDCRPFNSSLMKHYMTEEWKQALEIIEENKHKNLEDYPSNLEELKKVLPRK